MGIEVLYPTKAELRTGKRVVKKQSTKRIIVDRSVEGVEVDVEMNHAVLVLDDASAFELAWAILSKINQSKLAKVKYVERCKPQVRLWDELRRLCPDVMFKSKKED